MGVCPGIWRLVGVLEAEPETNEVGMGRLSLFMVGCTKLKSDPYSMRQNRCTMILGSLE